MSTAITHTTERSRFQRIALVPFVAVLYAYCAGGPFGYEAMVSTSGPGLSLIFLLAVPWLFSLPMALATAEMASAMPVEGGFYRWTRYAFGPFWGFQCGFWNWTGTFLMCGAYGVQLADYLAQLRPTMNSAQHWAIAFSFIVLVAYLNVRGIQLVGRVTVVLLLLAMVPVAIFTIIGIQKAHFNPFLPLAPPGKPIGESFGIGLALALWIYSGYEQLSTVGEEIEEPTKNFSRALMIVVPLAMITLALPIASGLAALGNWENWDTGYIVTAALQMGGPWLQWAMFAAACICTFVLLQSTLLSASRIPFAMAEDGYFAGSMAELHPRFRTPVRAIVISTVICAALAFFKLTVLIAIYAWLRVATSVLTLLSLSRLRKHTDFKPSFTVPGGQSGMFSVIVVPLVLFAWALIKSDPIAMTWGPIALLLGPIALVCAKLRVASKI